MSKICRTCFSRIDKEEEYYKLTDAQEDNKSVIIKTKLEFCVPEICLKRFNNSVICSNCLNNLDIAYAFKTKCFNVETKIHDYFVKVKYSDACVSDILEEIHRTISNASSQVLNSSTGSTSEVELKRKHESNNEITTPKRSCRDSVQLTALENNIAKTTRITNPQLNTDEISTMLTVSPISSSHTTSITQRLSPESPKMNNMFNRASDAESATSSVHDDTSSNVNNVRKTCIGKKEFTLQPNSVQRSKRKPTNTNQNTPFSLSENDINGNKYKTCLRNNQVQDYSRSQSPQAALVSNNIITVYKVGDLPPKGCSAPSNSKLPFENKSDTSIKNREFQDESNVLNDSNNSNLKNPIVYDQRSKIKLIESLHKNKHSSVFQNCNITDSKITALNQEEINNAYLLGDFSLTPSSTASSASANTPIANPRKIKHYLQVKKPSELLRVPPPENVTEVSLSLRTSNSCISTKDTSEETNNSDNDRTSSEIKSQRSTSNFDCVNSETVTLRKCCVQIDRLAQEDLYKAVQTIYLCEFCGFKTKTLQDLEDHFRFNHSDKQYICYFCTYRTFSLDDFDKHIEEMHVKPAENIKNTRYFCKVCNFTTKNKVNISIHNTNHSLARSSISDSYICKFCDIRSMSADQFRQHLRRHLNETLYSCSNCDLSWTNKNMFKQHVIDHSAMMHKCVQCNFQSTDSDKLRTHYLDLHFVKHPYKCYHCQRIFNLRVSILKHVLNVAYDKCIIKDQISSEHNYASDIF